MLMALIPQEQYQHRTSRRPWIVLGAVAVCVVLNTIAAIFGAQAGQDRATTLIDPAPYAFGVWGVIFAANVVFAVYQATPSRRFDPLLDRVAVPFVAGQVFGALFALAALVDSNPLGQISTVLYFAAAVATYAVLGIGRHDASWVRRGAAWLPASMSAAWLLAASLVVIAGFLQNDLEVSPPFANGEDWAVGAIALAALAAVALLIWARDFAFAAVTVWALIGISQEQANGAVDAAVVASVAVIGLVAVGMVPKATADLPWRRRGERERRLGAH